jgi:hypothetical protein
MVPISNKIYCVSITKIYCLMLFWKKSRLILKNTRNAYRSLYSVGNMQTLTKPILILFKALNTCGKGQSVCYK